MKPLDTRIIDLTIGEFIEALNERDKLDHPAIPALKPHEKRVIGLAGIANLLGCSRTTVNTYRRQGWIEPAIKQIGRKIICDAPLALELFGKQKHQTTK